MPSLNDMLFGRVENASPEAEAAMAEYYANLLEVRKQTLLELQAKVEEAWKACPDDGLEWLTELREYLKKELEE